MSDFGVDPELAPQEAASILLLKVALRLLGEARLRGDFGADAELSERAAALADELTGGAPSPDPRHAAVEANLLGPDRISLSAPFEEGSAIAWSLMLDGTLYDGGTVWSVRFPEVEPREPSEEERAELERRQAEHRARVERMRRFTATDFVRTIAAPPMPDAEVRVLAILLYADGFYVEHTYDKAPPPPFDPEITAASFFALRGEGEPEFEVEDDLGTEYFPSGGAGGGGVLVSHSSRGFAPAPPPEARVLKVTAGNAVVELDLTV